MVAVSGDVRSPSVVAKEDQEIRIAFIGNSMIYFNDSPRLVENMLKGTGHTVRQDSCLRGGATLSSLWEQGNGMNELFRCNAALIDSSNEISSYDTGYPTIEALIMGMEQTANTIKRRGRNVLIVNDHTQSPARIGSRDATAAALRENYLPCIYNNLRDSVLILFLQTPAYRFAKIKGTEDLGDFDEFTRRTREGYQFYSDIVQETPLADSQVESQIAPIGEAFRILRQRNKDLWEKLYCVDDFHPSPHGTWLQACILYALITSEAPPLYQASWWQCSRYIVDEQPLPTNAEAEELRKAACETCRITTRGQP